VAPEAAAPKVAPEATLEAAPEAAPETAAPEAAAPEAAPEDFRWRLYKGWAAARAAGAEAEGRTPSPGLSSLKEALAKAVNDL
jgi:hypothetical protein